MTKVKKREPILKQEKMRFKKAYYNKKQSVGMKEATLDQFTLCLLRETISLFQET